MTSRSSGGGRSSSDNVEADEIRYEVDECGIGWLTIDRPDVGNALTASCRSRMIDILRDAGNRLEIRCIVLTGAGDRHFCVGGDLRTQESFTYPEGAPERPVGEMRRRLEDSAQVLIGAILDCEVPVLAAVNGTAAGMGVQLALACDLVVATEQARFVEAFSRRGLVPDAGAAYLLPRLVGLQTARRLLLLDDDLTATDALDLGLVCKVVTSSMLHSEVLHLARRIASGPTTALGLTRKLLNRSLDESRDSAFALEAAAVEMNSRSVDVAEGLAAFSDRRTPDFRGW